MMSGQASPVAHLGHSQSDAILIILIILILIILAILIIVMIAINVTLTIIANIKAHQEDLKRTKRLWKMCLKLLCLSMAVDGSIARLPNICKTFVFTTFFIIIIIAICSTKSSSFHHREITQEWSKGFYFHNSFLFL